MTARSISKTCSVAGCEKIRVGRGWCDKHYRRFRRTGDPTKLKVKFGEGDNWIERFWSKVKKDANEKGCWEWQGIRDRHGYGKVMVGGKFRLAHRISLLYTTGEAPKLNALHKCDNPPCVNPEHLYEGTLQDNVRDRMKRGRGQKGETNGHARLTEADVISILRKLKSGAKPMALAMEYNMHHGAIYNIRNGRTWKHLSRPVP